MKDLFGHIWFTDAYGERWFHSVVKRNWRNRDKYVGKRYADAHTSGKRWGHIIRGRVVLQPQLKRNK